jgi:eukaryotic-like serine/threonine-protein kinase
LSALDAAFDGVAGGRAHVVLLRGPSGVGKTALGTEFLRRLAARAEAILLTGRCYERELVPYKAADGVMESLVRYLQRQPETDVRGWCPPDLAAAVHILPVLGRLSAVKALPAAAAADQVDLKRRAFSALRELLQRITARTPIVLFIDDLQWGAADSPALFAEWLRGPNAPRLLVVGAYRDQADQGGLWLKTWREVERKSGFAWTSDELTVSPLADDEARQLAQALSRHLSYSDGGEEFAKTIAQRAMGHPLFLRELVEHANVVWDELANPTKKKESRQAGRPQQNDFPSLSDMLGGRLAALDADAYRLLEVVAVAGYPITLERAHRAAGLALDRRAVLYTLVDANLVRTIADDRLGKLVAYHDSVRETLVSRSSAEALRDAHRRLAEAAALESPLDDEALVLHYQGAGQAELAAKHAAAAADRAAQNLAFDLAIRCYRLALESPAWTDDERRALRLHLAQSLAQAGRSAEAGEEYRQLAQAAGGDDRWAFMYESGEQFMRAGMIGPSLDMLAPLFRHHGLRPPQTGRVSVVVGLLCRRAWLGLTGYRVRPRPLRCSGKRILAQSDLCSRVGGGLTFFDGLGGAALILQGSHLALRSGDDGRVALALTFEAIMSALAGKRRRAANFIGRSEVLARRARDDFTLGGIFLTRGIGLILDGEWPQALEQLDAMKETVHRCPGKRFEAMQAEWYRQYPLFYSGELRQLAERLSDHLQDTLDCQNLFFAALLRLNIGNLAWLAADRPDDARRQIDEARPERTELSMMQHYEALTAQLRLDLYLGQAAAAWRRMQDEWPWLARSGRLHMTFFTIEVHHLCATIAVAVMHQAAGDRTMLRALRRSIGYLERQPAAWPRALASLSRAGLLSTQGDTPAAIAMYQTANQSLTEAQMPHYAAAARRRLGELLSDEHLIAQADAALVERGVSNPRRFAALLAG